MMVLTFVLSQCFIVKLLTKPILLSINLVVNLNINIGDYYSFKIFPRF